MIRHKPNPFEPTFVVATCGHPTPVNGDTRDPYYQQKLEKLAGRPCRHCRVVAAEERQRIAEEQRRAALVQGTAGSRVKKGQEPKLLPAGTVITLVRQDDGSWIGKLIADSIEVKAESAGLMGLGSTLARRWLAQQGAKLKGKV